MESACGPAVEPLGLRYATGELLLALRMPAYERELVVEASATCMEWPHRLAAGAPDRAAAVWRHRAAPEWY